MTIDLKKQVEQAVRQEWETFAREHPNLAGVMDARLVIEQAADALADDPEYQQAMQHAAALGLGANTVAELVEQFVRGWLRRLI